MSRDAHPWFIGDATALAQAIARGECSAVQALDRTLADIAAINPRLNAVCLLRPDIGRAVAAALDAELGRCRTDAERRTLLAAKPFFGVPLLLKDLGLAVAHPDFPSRQGSRLFGPRGREWAVRGTLVERYEAAGFVIFGRTTTPEMGISASTEAVAYGGPTRNPWNPAHSAGGSSGGSAAAVASGMVTIAHGNDGGGSIRIPASACGLIGLKPSRGLIPAGPMGGECGVSLGTDHVLTRSVRDCAAALDVGAGADPGAPFAAPQRPASYAAALRDAPRGLRVGMCNGFYEGDPVDPEVAAVVAAFADRLDRLGHTVKEARPGFGTLDVVRPVMELIAIHTAAGLQAVEAARGRPITADEIEPSTFGALQYGRGSSGPDYVRAAGALNPLARRMGRFFIDHDVFLTPTLAEPAATLGRFAMNNPDFMDYRLGPNGLWRYTPFAPLANALGLPSITLPAGRSADGRPIGALLTGPLGSDALLLAVAAQWEADQPDAAVIAPVR